MYDSVEVPAERGAASGDGNAALYFELPQHPVAKKIYEQFSMDTKLIDTTIGEKVHFENIDGDICLYKFFDAEPVTQSFYIAALQHQVQSHVLFKLNISKEIRLHSFNGSAGVTPLSTGPNEEVLAPGKGMFVIEWGDILFVLHIIPHGGGRFEWIFYSKSMAEFSKWYAYFKQQWKVHNQYTNQVFDSSGKFLDLPKVTLDDIYLEDYIRREVQINILDYVDPEKLQLKRAQGLPTKRGVLFTGVPGTGKTFLSRIIASTLNTTFMVVSHLRDISELEGWFEFVSMFDRFILLFEDIDIYSGNRDQEMLGALLNKLDGMEVNNHLITICTTNELDTLDDALKKRPGRFDRILTFNLPNAQLKAEMLKGFCKLQDTTEIDFLVIAKQLPADFSGAHVKEVFITACTNAIDENSLNAAGQVKITTSHFTSALRSLRKVQETRRPLGFECPE